MVKTLKMLLLTVLFAACGTENHVTDSGFKDIEGTVECADGACRADVIGPETCLAVVQLLTKNSVFAWRRVDLKEGEVLSLPAQAPLIEENFTLVDSPKSFTYRCY